MHGNVFNKITFCVEYASCMCTCTTVQDLAEYDRLKLTSEQVDKYWEQGYLSNIPVLSEEQCDTLLKDYMNVFHSVSFRQPFFCIYYLHTNITVRRCLYFFASWLNRGILF